MPSVDNDQTSATLYEHYEEVELPLICDWQDTE